MKNDFTEGQSILEYTLVLGVVIGIIVAVLVNKSGSVHKGIEGAYNKTASAIGEAASNLSNTVFR